MPDNQSAGATPAAGGATPLQTPAPSADPPATSPATGAAGSDDGPLGESGKGALEKERQARRDADAKATAAQAELTALKQANMTAAEKQAARLTELERKESDWGTERQSLLLQMDVERHAARLGFADPTDALGLLDRRAIEFNADGTPKNTDKLLEALVKAKPYLTRAGSAGASFDTGTGGAGAAGAGAGRTYTRAQLKDVAFFEANKADILKAHAEGRIRP